MIDGSPPVPAQTGQRNWKAVAVRILVLGIILGVTIAIFAFREQLAELAAIGYPGIFLVSLLGNATIILPAPSLALVFAMGSALPPLAVGLSAGVGEALGELTGYAAGSSGRAVIENQHRYEKLVHWMGRRGGITILVLSVFPNPFFDLAGIAAGTLRYPLWRFLVFCWLGKTLKTVLVAYAGAHSFTLIEPLLG